MYICAELAKSCSKHTIGDTPEKLKSLPFDSEPSVQTLVQDFMATPQTRVTPRDGSGSAREISGSYDRLAQTDEDVAREHLRKLAYAKTTIGITMREGGTCKVESSVYGAAIVMPQLARTTGWDRTLSILAIRSWFFLFLNVVLQVYLLAMLAKEDTVMDLFAGQMYLCDFGKNLAKCPGPGCTGPGGTDVTAPRMYNWDQWSLRLYVRQAFKDMFPDRMTDINKFVDPGEYGVESYWCRFVCIFIFMIPCMRELNIIAKMAELLVRIPTDAEPWIDPKEEIVSGLGMIDEVTIKIAGMPMIWKIMDFMFIVLPKLLLWKMTAETGTTFLMETGGIQDIIINSVGLAFIVDLDELICDALMSEETKAFVAACEEFVLYDQKTSCVGDMSALTEDEILIKHHDCQQSWSSWSIWDLWGLFPGKLCMSLILTTGFCYEYYWKHCKLDDEGNYVSKDMFLPTSVVYTWLNAVFPFFYPVHKEESPYWTMPDISTEE